MGCKKSKTMNLHSHFQFFLLAYITIILVFSAPFTIEIVDYYDHHEEGEIALSW